LWLSSLVLGDLTILSIIASGVYIGLNVIGGEDFPKKHRLPAILGGSVVALFFLGFFSLHFCGFHAGHAGFLSVFSPITGLRERDFFDAFMNPILLWKTVFQHLLPVYGIFLVPAVIAERRHVFASLTESIRAGREWTRNRNLQKIMESGRGRKKTIRDPFFRPYINVIRMHILIFFFAFCHALKLDSFLVYAAVYFVYFFPWKAFREDSPGELLPQLDSQPDAEA
jgi:hypothetical protein